MSEILEKKLEEKMKFYVEKLGGEFHKLELIGRSGIPDRVILFPDIPPVYVELKQKGKKPRKLQMYEIGKLRGKAFRVEVIDNFKEGKELIDEIIKSR